MITKFETNKAIRSIRFLQSKTRGIISNETKKEYIKEIHRLQKKYKL